MIFSCCLQAVGSSAQGLTNAFLFCVFTSMVRKRLVRAIRRLFCWCTCCADDSAGVYLLEPSTNYSVGSKVDVENTTQYDDAHDVRKGKEGGVKGGMECTRGKPTPTMSCSTPHLFPESLENSKNHSMSVGKRVTTGAE